MCIRDRPYGHTVDLKPLPDEILDRLTNDYLGEERVSSIVLHYEDILLNGESIMRSIASSCSFCGTGLNPLLYHTSVWDGRHEEFYGLLMEAYFDEEQNDDEAFQKERFLKVVSLDSTGQTEEARRQALEDVVWTFPYRWLFLDGEPAHIDHIGMEMTVRIPSSTS